MQPQQPSNRADVYQPKWRHFPPLSTLWVQNPFDHDIEFPVADEMNRQFMYVLPAHKVSELPGGAIATLGLKWIIDELIQNDKSVALRIWEPELRAEYEKDVIVRYKEAPTRETSTNPAGVIDLSVKDKDVPDEDEAPADTTSQEFPDLDGEPVVPVPVATGVTPPSVLDAAVKGEADMTLAGLPDSAELADAGE